MSKYQISFKLLDYKPIIPDNIDYSFQILSYDTKFRDYISLATNNKITDFTNYKKNIKYIIKLIKKGKILAVGNLTINQDLLSKKIKQKKYNNINLFITENNYKKIFPNINISKVSKYQAGISLSIEINIKYNNIKEKEINLRKLKLIRRNFSYPERGNNKDYSIKSINNLTTSTTNINTFNNINNAYENENNYNVSNTETNVNVFPSDKYIITTPQYLLSSPNVGSPMSDSDINPKRKKIIRKGLINNISFKNNNKKIKNRIIESKRNKNYYNVFDLRNKINQKSSRNNKYLYNKKNLNILITQESNSSKNTNTITPSSIINSALIEKNEDISSLNSSKNNTINNINDTIQNILNNKSAYNKDNETVNISYDFYINEIETRKNNLLTEQAEKNLKLFNQDEKYNQLLYSIKSYENKIKDSKIIINKLQEKNELLKYKEEIILERNKELIPIISKVKQAKELENNIINSILNNYKNSDGVKKNGIESNLEKYDKNLMVKMLKNVIQSNHNVDLYLKDEYKKKLKIICDKYNIFGSIIEDVDE